jgi:SAM-dependent methyltransferase
MFYRESRWIADQAKNFAPDAATLIDVGSGSPYYRDTTQKHIADMYARLRANDVTITTLDSDPDNRPDIVCDIGTILDRPAEHDIVLASNLLEHVQQSQLGTVIGNLFRLVRPGGVVIITVPFNLPKHERPIDNMLRPTPQELTTLVAHRAVHLAQWEDVHYREPYLSNPSMGCLPVVTGGVFQ